MSEKLYSIKQFVLSITNQCGVYRQKSHNEYFYGISFFSTNEEVCTLHIGL